MADSITDNAIKYIFFPTANSFKAVFLTSGKIELYEPDTEMCQKCHLLMFSNGFMLCRKSVERLRNKGGNKGGLLKRLGSLFEDDEGDDLEQSKFGEIQSAFLLSDIDRVETLELWDAKETKKHLKGKNDLGHAFAVFTRHHKSPIIICCATKEDVDSWINTFRICISGQKSKVLGRNRQTVKADGVVFGINNRKMTRHTTSTRMFKDSIQWDDDDDDF